MPVKLTVTRPADFVEFRRESIQQGIHERFEEQVRLHPRNIALKTRTAAHTYAETNGFANSIAAEILSAAGTKLAQAALLLPNSPEMIIAILAALKAHKAYVPLDPHFPKDRLHIMHEDAEPEVVLTDDEHLALAGDLAGKRARIINISRIKQDAAAPNPEVPCDPMDRAYILFTSGSTGRPKGIAYPHRNLLHTIMCLTNALFFAPSDRVTWLHSASFSASKVEIYCCLANGAALYPWDAKTQGFTGMAEWLDQEKVTAFLWIPSAFRQFLRTVPEDFVFRNIRIVVMASESLTLREVELFRKHFPEGSHLVNQVGTSECYNYRLYPVDHHIPIESVHVAGGYSVSEDRQVVILDEEQRELSPGEVGEIGVRTDFMATGYWRDDSLTRSKFVKIGGNDIPVYLTGDLGKLEPDGCLIHLGRKDFQVKIRGYRVELAEVEHVLTSAPGVADCAAWVVKNRLGEDQLVGYVLLKVAGQFDQPQVEAHLAARLPDYMVPRHYVILDSFPTLPTGKVNRRGLPNPLVPSESLPQTTLTEGSEVTQAVMKLFAELLQSDDTQPDTDFLKAGGDSLLTGVLLHQVFKKFKVEIKIEDFGANPTPASLARLIAGGLERGKVTAPGATTPSSTESRLAAKARVSTSRTTLSAQPKPGATQNLIIISAGKFGRETYSWAEQAIAAGAPLKIKGFLDDRPRALDGYDYAVRVLGDVENYKIEEDDVFVGAIGAPEDKVKYYSPIIERGGRFTNVIHPLANIGRNARLGTGIVMGPFSCFSCDVKIGNHISIGSFSNVGHDVVVGDWCQISSHCGINGNATLEDGVFLGSHACIIPGIHLGAWSFMGAGSVVIRDVPAGARVFGNPADRIGLAARPGGCH
jgi:sugar O-acyltransferase (sialic acid O-acetyltransferase NeuD family)